MFLLCIFVRISCSLFLIPFILHALKNIKYYYLPTRFSFRPSYFTFLSFFLIHSTNLLKSSFPPPLLLRNLSITLKKGNVLYPAILGLCRIQPKLLKLGPTPHHGCLLRITYYEFREDICGSS